MDRVIKALHIIFPKFWQTRLAGKSRSFFCQEILGNSVLDVHNCFRKSETLCPHYEKINPLTEALDEADVLIFESPVYVYHVTGSMKAFFRSLWLSMDVA